MNITDLIGFKAGHICGKTVRHKNGDLEANPNKK